MAASRRYSSRYAPSGNRASAAGPSARSLKAAVLWGGVVKTDSELR